MKILNLSLDKSALDGESNLFKRLSGYGSLVEKYIVVVPNKFEKKIESQNLTIIGSGGLNKFFQLINIWIKAKKIIQKDKIDLITIQDYYYLGILACFLKEKFNLKLEVQVHGFEKYSGLRKAIAKSVVRRADSVRAVSQRLKRFISSEFKIEEDKIRVISVPVKKPDVIFEKEEKNKLVFLTVGRLVPVKNIFLQIRAFKKAKVNMPNAELWIVGDGEERKRLERVTGGDPAIVFFGWQKNIFDFYGQADVFLLTSKSEGWGMAVVEAANFSLPIIMTDVGCAGEVIKNEESGLVVPIGDKEALSEAMIKIYKDEGLRRRLGQAAKEAVKNLPNAEDTARLHYDVWTRIIK